MEHQEGAPHSERWRDIVDAVKANRTPGEITISDCSFGNDAAEQLSSGLRDNTTLKSLRIEGCRIAAKGWAFIADALETNDALKDLRIKIMHARPKPDDDDGDEDEDKDVGFFGDACAEQFASVLCHNSSLVTLHLEGCRIGMRGAIAISSALEKNNTTLEELKMGQTSFGCPGAHALRHMLCSNASLKTLLLPFCCFGPHGWLAIADALTNNDTLEELDISHACNEMGCASIQIFGLALAANTSLKRMNIDSCEIGVLGARSIAAALEDNFVLEELSMNNNEIMCAGAEMLGEALSSNSSLKKLWVQGCEMGCENCDSGMLAFSVALKLNNTLQELDMSDNNIGCSGVELIGKGLASNKTLVKLGLRDCTMGCESCGRGSRALSKGLMTNATLEKLDVSGSSLSLAGTRDFAGMLAVNSTLKMLDLDGCGIVAKGSRALVKAMEINASLEHLDMAGSIWSSKGIKALKQALETNTTLKILSLEDCDITVDGLRGIAEALNTCSSIEELIMGSSTFGNAHAEALAKGLSSSSKSLKNLSLTGCAFTGCKGFKAIADAIQTNTELEELDLRRNHKIGGSAVGSEALAQLLSCNKSLKTLKLGGCDIGEETVRELGRALGSNWALVDMDVAFSDGSGCAFLVPDGGGFESILREEADNVRKQEKLLAFAMGMHDRLGGKPPAEGGSSGFLGYELILKILGEKLSLQLTDMVQRRLGGENRNIEKDEVSCAFHGMYKDVFRLVGDAYQRMDSD
jgi:Ran GTPase-activating protein (RanGAP) involved in mRNA processing and transport